MSELLRDLRYGWRGFVRAPVFSLVAVATLALGIGANATIFSVVNGILLQPLPYGEPDRIVRIWPQHSKSKDVMERVRKTTSSFSEVSGYWVMRGALTGVGEAQELAGIEVTTNHFAVLGVSPMLGRSFAVEERSPGNGDVVILGHELWQRRFDSDRQILGQPITLAGASRTVIGVMAPEHRPIADGAQFWIPSVLDPSDFSDYAGMAKMTLLARLAPEASVAGAGADLQTFASRMHEDDPKIYNDAWLAGARVLPLRESLVANVESALWLLLGAVAVVLLIACANVANLLLARAGAREREIAIRVGLGAARGRVVRQLLTESAMLSVLGGAAGLVVAWLVLRGLSGVLPASLPRTETIGMNVQVFGFAIGLSLLASLVFGLVPAIRATRSSTVGALKDGNRSATSGAGRLRLNRALVAAEIGLSVLLVAGAGLLLRSLSELGRVDPGFNAEQVLTGRVRLPEAGRFEDPEARSQFFDELASRVAALPGVQQAGLVTYLPMTTGLPASVYERPDAPLPEGVDRRYAQFQLVTPGYFRTMGIRLERGRVIEASDREGAPMVGVINQTLAREAFGDEDPIGRRMGMFGGGADFTVAGVVTGSRQYGPRTDPRPEAYFAYDQLRWMHSMYLTVRATDAAGMVASIRATVREMDATVPFSDIRTMEVVVSGATAQTRFFTFLLMTFGGLALVLGAAGVYGVLSYVVSQRVREIGIRIALGAERSQIVREAMGWAAAPVLLGIGAGVLGAFGATRLLSGMLFEITPTDPLTFAAVPLIMVLVAAVASYLPARRAARVDPIVSLRAD